MRRVGQIVETRQADNTGERDVAAIYSAAHNVIVQSQTPGIIVFPCGTFRFDSPITLDESFVAIEGVPTTATGSVAGTTLDFSRASSGITVNASVSDPDGRARDVIYNITIKGPNDITCSGTSKGIYLNDPEDDVCHITFKNVVVTQFNKGITYGDNAFIFSFDHCKIFGNYIGFETPVVSSDAGEKIVFTNCTIFNNPPSDQSAEGYGLRIMNDNAQVYLTNTSIDYNHQAIFISAGYLSLVGCYGEVSSEVPSTFEPFLYMSEGGNAVVSITGSCFHQGNSMGSIPFFEIYGTNTLNVSESDFFMNNNSEKIMLVHSLAKYNEHGVRIWYHGPNGSQNARIFESGATYCISGIATNGQGYSTSGNLGIGVTNPVTQAQLKGSGQNTAAFSDWGNTGGALFLHDASQLYGSGGALLFGGQLGNKWFAAIKGLLTNGEGNSIGDLALSLRTGVNDPYLTPRLTIKSNGNVGIGTESPSFKTEITNNTPNDGSDSKGLKITANAQTMGTAKSYGLWVNASGSDDRNYAAIFENGNVGIGTTIPEAKLEVVGDVKATQYKTQAGNGYTGTLTLSGGQRIDVSGGIIIGNPY